MLRLKNFTGICSLNRNIAFHAILFQISIPVFLFNILSAFIHVEIQFSVIAGVYANIKQVLNYILKKNWR